CRWTTSKKSGIDALERVDVEDAQRRMIRPIVECRCPEAAAEALGHPVGHPPEPHLRITGPKFVEMHEAWIGAVEVLVRRDHQPTTDLVVVARRDVADVREVSPVPKRLR